MLHCSNLKTKKHSQFKIYKWWIASIFIINHMACYDKTQTWTQKTNAISASIQKQTVKLNSSPEYELGWSSD